MIQLRSILKPTSNSGAKRLMVHRVLGGASQRHASLGDLIFASVKQALPNADIKKGEKVRAVIVRTRKEVRRKDGSYIRFDDNAAVIVDNDGNPRGTRIFGPVAREVKEKGFAKIAAMSKELI